MEPERDLSSPAGGDHDDLSGPAGHADLTGPELVDDWTRPVGRAAIRRGRGLPNLRVTTPVAFLAGILVTALAAGVMLRPGAVADSSPASAGQDVAAAAPGTTAGQLGAGGGREDDAGLRGGLVANPQVVDRTPDPTVEPTPVADPTAEPKVEPTPDPTPVPTAKPKPTPTPVPALTLNLGLKSGYPYMTWSACEGASFDYYKVVRSTDSAVAWPTGSGDSLVGAVSPGASLAAKDTGAPKGVRVYYRVFCVKSTGSGWSVVRSSTTKAVDVPAATEPPAPPTACTFSLGTPVVSAALPGGGLTIATNGGGGPAVTLDWTDCASEGLTYYKVVRSPNPNPTYIPGGNGSVLIAAITPGNGTYWMDHPGSGTWYYRVQAVGNNPDGSHVVLGQTQAVMVVVP